VVGTECWKVFVGYDSREDIAWQVCRHSIARHSSDRVSVHPLRQTALRDLGLYDRPVDLAASTEFSLTRFLTPYLAADDGWSLFVDCDVLFTRPLDDLFGSLSPDKAVYVVKHDYVPANAIKMDGKVQAVYERKNWSSLIVFNGAHPAVRALTPAVVNAAEPAFLHRFRWVDDDAIGTLDLRWNFLEGEYPVPDETPAAIHFTNGGPWFDRWQNVAYSDLWRQERDLYERETAVQPMAGTAVQG
jgi:lipopolysaccharide biosynthesis glycosyltransferase